MSDDPKALGNDVPTEGDLPETVESPAAEPESQESPEKEGQGEEFWKRKYLDAKQAEEKANELQRRLEALESRPAQSPAAPDTQDEDDDLSPDEEAYLRSVAKTEEGTWAKVLLKTNRATQKERAARENLTQELVYAEQLRPVPENERREAVLEWKKNPHLYASPVAAHKALKSEKLEARNAELERKLAAYERGQKPEVQNAVPTDSRQATKQPPSREWTEEAFDAEEARIRATKGEIAAMQFAANAPDKWKR
jgi:hypothetical protein